MSTSTEYSVPGTESSMPSDGNRNGVPGTRYAALLMLLALVLGVAISLLLNLAVPEPTFKDDMPGGPYRYEGMFDPPGNSYGYFDTEKGPSGESYRWTTAHAYTTFPYAANAGRYADVSIRMGAFQATAQDPISVEVMLNGKPYARLLVSGPFQVYNMKLDTRQLPNPYLDPAHVQIDLLSATRSTPQDPRQLGVAVDWITVEPARDLSEIAIEAAVWAFFLVLIAAVALVRFGLRWGLTFAGLALVSFVLLHITYMPRSIGVEVEVGLAGVAWLLAALLSPRRLPLVGLVIAALLVWIVVAGRLLGEWQMDDAFISYRYAWNLVHGNGLVYNVGEPVEGYTNFLWTLLSAGAMQLGWDPLSVAQAANILVSQCLIALAFVASTWLVVWNRRPTTDDRRPTTDNGQPTTDNGQPATGNGHSAFRIPNSAFIWPLLVAALLAVDVSLVFYGAKGSGMESASFALTVMLSLVLLWADGEYRVPTRTAPVAVGRSSIVHPSQAQDRSSIVHRPSSVDGTWYSVLGTRYLVLRAAAGLSLALGVLLRPEGLFVAALVLAVRGWQDWREGRPIWCLLGWALLPFLIVIVPYQVWRTGFYGYPFPNTFYAKTGLTLALLERGIVYVGQFTLPHWLIAVPAFLGVVGWLIAWLRARRRRSDDGAGRLRLHSMLPALFLLTAVYTLYIIWVGGDHFPAMRFFVPLLVPMVLLAQEAFRGGLRLIRSSRSLTYAAAGALALAVLVYAGISLWMQTDAGPLGQRGNRETTAWERWGSAALWLREETPSNTTLAAFAAGAMAYFSDRYTIDMLGLNDVHIAHVQTPNMGTEVAGHEKQDPPYVLARRPDYILATWEDYFSSIAAQVTANYGYETVDSPTGTPVKWLRRKDTQGP